jgi:hypothetical protein
MKAYVLPISIKIIRIKQNVKNDSIFEVTQVNTAQ